MTRRTIASSRRINPLRRRALGQALERLEDRHMLAAGALDTSLGGIGYVQIQATEYYDQQYAVAVNATRQIITAGRSWNISGGPQHRDAVIAKFNVNGSLDTTFGDAGKVVESFGSTTSGTRVNVIWDVAIDHDNMIVVVGETATPDGTTGFVARYDQNGNPDTTFGGTGVVFLPPRYLNSLAIDSQNRVAVLGYSYDVDPETAIAGPTYLYVARLTETGGVDFELTNQFDLETPTFGTHAYEHTSELAVDSLDRIVVTGSTGATNKPFVARYLSTGGLDSAFGSGGVKFGDDYDEYRGVTIDAHNNVVVAGSTPIPGEPGKNIVTARFRAANGTFDPSFSFDGRVITTVPGQSSAGSVGHSVAVGANGRITVGASSGGIALIRFQPNGTIDSTFGVDGIVTAHPNSGSQGMAVDSIGRIVIGNTVGESFGIARFLPNNAPPVLAGIGGAATYAENTAPRILVPTATVTDRDNANFAGGRLTVQVTGNPNVDDRLGVRNEGTGADQISVDAANVIRNGVIIGTQFGGNGLTPLIINLTADATLAATQALLRNITFHTLGDNPSTLQRTATFTLADGDGGTSAARTKLINVTAINDRPVLGGISTTPVEYQLNNATPVILAGDATVTDADSPNFEGGKLIVAASGGGAAAGNQLSIGGALFSVDGSGNVKRGSLTIGTATGHNTGRLEVTFNADALGGYVQQVVRAIRFRTVGSTNTADRVVSFTVFDGFGAANGAASTTLRKTVEVS